MPRDSARGRHRPATTSVTAVLGLLALLLQATPAESRQMGPNATGGADPTIDSSAVTPAMVDAGRAIFHQKGLCFACHGPQLEGTQVAPTLKAHAWRDAKNGDLQAILGVVSKGVPSTAMVSYPGGISPAEARAVSSYVWSVGRGRAKP